MHTDADTAGRLGHDHSFGHQHRRAGERRTLAALVLTGAFMVVEIAAGLAYGSMALLADGLHMASHTSALGIAVVAYVYARRLAFDRRFSFGTGKFGSLAGFASAILLVLIGAAMLGESIHRLFVPVRIVFDQAIVVAVIGLAVNGASVVILGPPRAANGHEHGHEHDGNRHDHHHDHNLRAAYLHVLADALTSVLAIVALLAGKFYGLAWMDPLMGVIGAGLVGRWSWILLGQTSRVLTDHAAPEAVRGAVQAAIEAGDDNRVTDLHVWLIGPNMYCAIIAVMTHAPKPPEHYRALVPAGLGLVHVTVEVHRCPDAA